ncbi:hypothetical protein PoB_001692500 [Plakobranchus ocellatus]|uniref:Uncharacterized protein n=1 Tax=Plakobranchus ocellatus TaxID=259542 RepID=A0AAV3Z5J8_9GAST|nr:hypothetical protein PoB_001692500 [Plakobranchus ocellatus]
MGSIPKYATCGENGFSSKALMYGVRLADILIEGRNDVTNSIGTRQVIACCDLYGVCVTVVSYLVENFFVVSLSPLPLPPLPTPPGSGKPEFI